MDSFRRFKDIVGTDTTRFGMVLASTSPYCAEICASSGLDWLLIDGEHAPNDLMSIIGQLQAVQAYAICPVVRAPVGDTVLIKQYLDIGVQNLVIPMIESVDQAEAMARAVRYPPRGVRGVGSAVARASRWNRLPNYLNVADDSVTLIVQVESEEGLKDIEAIAAVDGVDGVFFGPSDLAASFGLLGQQDHPSVMAAVEEAIQVVVAAGKAAGVSAFREANARRYAAAGASFVLVGSDVGILVQGSAALCSTYIPSPD